MKQNQVIEVATWRLKICYVLCNGYLTRCYRKPNVRIEWDISSESNVFTEDDLIDVEFLGCMLQEYLWMYVLDYGEDVDYIYLVEYLPLGVCSWLWGRRWLYLPRRIQEVYIPLDVCSWLWGRRWLYRPRRTSALSYSPGCTPAAVSGCRPSGRSASVATPSGCRTTQTSHRSTHWNNGGLMERKNEGLMERTNKGGRE